MYVCILSSYVLLYYLHTVSVETRRELSLPRTRVKGSVELPYGCWKIETTPSKTITISLNP